MLPEISQYGIVPTIGVWIVSIVWLWLRLRHQEAANRNNGSKLGHHETVIAQLASKIVEMEGEHKRVLETLGQEKAKWQVRAYDCEERERQRA